MVKGNKDKFVLELGKDESGEPKTLSAEETLKQMKRGFNNGSISFEYPFLWQEIKTEEEDIKAIVDLVTENDLDPAIIFCFSKEKCEALAKSLQKSGINLTTEEEKKTIEEIYICAILTLSEEDQNIPEIKNMLNILKLGLGIHHGGMVPIIRECVELIFQSGLIKILFSTETFSMGLNMPAKTVIFTEIEKFDGISLGIYVLNSIISQGA